MPVRFVGSLIFVDKSGAMGTFQVGGRTCPASEIQNHTMIRPMKQLLFILAASGLVLGTSIFAANTPPVNEECPVCHKDGRLIFHSEVRGERVIFATADCKKKFDSSPGKYPVKKKKN